MRNICFGVIEIGDYRMEGRKETIIPGVIVCFRHIDAVIYSAREWIGMEGLLFFIMIDYLPIDSCSSRASATKRKIRQPFWLPFSFSVGPHPQ